MYVDYVIDVRLVFVCVCVCVVVMSHVRVVHMIGMTLECSVK